MDCSKKPAQLSLWMKIIAAVLVAFWWFTRISILEFDSRVVSKAKKKESFINENDPLMAHQSAHLP